MPIDRNVLKKMRKRVNDLRQLERKINKYVKSFSPADCRVRRNRNFTKQIEIKKLKKTKVSEKRSTEKEYKQRLSQFKFPHMERVTRVPLQTFKDRKTSKRIIKNLKEKIDSIKIAKIGIVTPNLKKRRNLSIIHNSRSRIKNKITESKNEPEVKLKQRLLSPMPTKGRMAPFFSSINSKFLEVKEAQAANPGKSERHSRYSKILNKSRASECDSVFSSIIMNYMQEETQESTCHKKRSFYQNIKNAKGKYSTFFEELTNNNEDECNMNNS